ncbi:hypothetical protein AB3N02_22600 [Priestia aryabhattai]|uniref:DUF4376 domain-containing protein n=1 Tax=Priestia aryabhattai TaxID=412384 RepID=UPI0039A0C1E3
MQVNKVIVLIQVDENGYEIEPVIFNLYDEEGNLKEIPNNLVPPNGSKRLWKPKWDFQLKDWFEGDAESALIERKTSILGQYNMECKEIIETGFYHNGDFFAFSMVKDQANFAQQMTFLLLRPDITTVSWMTENNGKKYYSREEFFAICGSGEMHKRKYMNDYWDLTEYITNVIQDVETLNSLGTFEEAVQKMKQVQ